MFEAQNGATSVIRYSNKRVNAKLSLTFKNLSNQYVDNILETTLVSMTIGITSFSTTTTQL